MAKCSVCDSVLESTLEEVIDSQLSVCTECGCPYWHRDGEMVMPYNEQYLAFVRKYYADTGGMLPGTDMAPYRVDPNWATWNEWFKENAGILPEPKVVVLGGKPEPKNLPKKAGGKTK